VSGANYYWLAVATSLSALPTNTNAQSCPGCIITQFSLSGTSYTPSAATLSGNATYYWEVQAYSYANGNVTEEGQFSPQWSFTTQSSLLPAPSLSSPSNGATGVSTPPTFSWSAVSGANYYWLAVATSLSALPTNTNAQGCPGCVISKPSLTGTSYTPSAGTLSGSTIYYWEVQGYAATGSTVTEEGQFSSQWIFETQ
jgi:hypothetical protein